MCTARNIYWCSIVHIFFSPFGVLGYIDTANRDIASIFNNKIGKAIYQANIKMIHIK